MQSSSPLNNSNKGQEVIQSFSAAMFLGKYFYHSLQALADLFLLQVSRYLYLFIKLAVFCMIIIFIDFTPLKI